MRIGCAPVLPQPESRLQTIWVGPDVCRLLAINLGCWQNNVGLRPPILSINLGRKLRCLQAGARMFAGRYSYWATFRQWASLDAHVKKGEKGSPVVFYKPLVVEEEEEEKKVIPLLRYSTVFNADQQEGWEPPAPEVRTPAQIVEEVQRYFQQIGADVRHGGGRAFYRPSQDYIQMPPMAAFTGTDTSTATEAYYSTLGHEHCHWTGQASRLGRDLNNSFGDEAYAGEELIAELGAAFLCAKLGISNQPRPDHVQYIRHWQKRIRDDARAIFKASASAEKAVEFLDVQAKGSSASASM